MSLVQPKILLVYPPNQLMAIEMPRPDGSLGPLYLAGALRRAGFEVDLLDASVGSSEDKLSDTFHNRVLLPNGLTRIGMTPDRLREYFTQGNYDIVGISSNFTPQTRMALEVAKIAKEVNPKTLVIAGGVNARALTDRFLASRVVDVIILTEGEKIIVDLVNAWQRNASFDEVNGIIYMRTGFQVTRPVSLPLENLDELPFPAWDLLPFAKYDEINSPHGSIISSKKRRYAPIMTSRGCPFRCTYCHVSEERKGGSLVTGEIGELRLKTIDRVMQEVEILRSLGVTHLYIEDDSLLAKKKRVKDLFQRLTGLGLKISGVNGVNLVHFSKKVKNGNGRLETDMKFMEILPAAGFDEIVFPVESGNQRILDKYATGKLLHDQLDVVQLVRDAVKLGITCPVNMMIGFPDETKAEMNESVELAKRLVDAGSKYVTFFIPIPFPGSKLYNMAIDGGHLSADFDPDKMNWKNPVMTNTEVPPEEVVAFRDWAWETVNTEDYKRKRKEKEIGDTRFAK